MDNSGTLLALVLAGVAMFVLGFIWLHHVTSERGWLQRLGSVGTVACGAFFLWAAAAATSPALVNQETEIVKAGPGWVISRIEFDKARKCDIVSIEGEFVENDTIHTSKSLYLPMGALGERREYGYVAAKIAPGMDADKFKVVVKVKCPFGFNLTSEFPMAKLPQGFRVYE